MDKQTLYLECYSGISGDMTVAALLDLGADEKVLLEGLQSLKVAGYQIKIGRKSKNSIDACDFDVILTDPEDHEHSHQQNRTHKHNHNDDQIHDLTHSHDHVLSHSHDHSNDLIHDLSHSHSHNHYNHHNHIHSQEHKQLKLADSEHKLEHNHETGHQHKHNQEDYDLDQLYSKKHHIHSSPALAKSSPHHLVLGHHDHRNLIAINDIIDNSSITARAKQLAKQIFLIIAEAEAKAHAKPLDEVHFHEVGAVDSIVDIVAAAICLDNLNITNVIVSELYEGTGQIMCQHGLLPIPVPAVVNISSAHQLRLHITNVQGELVTPTGAAIVAAIKTKDRLPEDFRIRKIGLGAGKRNYTGASGILRAMLIEESETSKPTTKPSSEDITIFPEKPEAQPIRTAELNISTSNLDISTSSNTASTTSTSIDKVWVLEANIDDCTGEALSFTMDLLFQKGAKDVYYSPIFMKKNRPAYMIGVICSEEYISDMEYILFTHTTTIGIRRHAVIRTILPREIRTITTPYGEAKVKVCQYNDRTYYYPEYEDVKHLVLSSGQDYLSIYELIKNLAKSD